MNSGQLRQQITTVIRALQVALDNLPLDHSEPSFLASMGPQIPARLAYRELSKRLGVSQRQCPGLMQAWGYTRVKREEGIMWTRTAGS